MNKADLENVLSLLVAAIFADGRVLPSEIKAFLHAASRLDVGPKLASQLSEKKLSTWYEKHKDDIRDKITSPYFKDWFYELLENLSEFEDKDALLAMMKDIALADGRIHVSERTLVGLAARYWGINIAPLAP